MAVNLAGILTGALGGALGATPLGGILGAVTGTTGGAGGTVGGTVLARGRGMMLIQSPSGKKVLVRTMRRGRRYAPRSRGTTLDKMLQMAMIKSIMK